LKGKRDFLGSLAMCLATAVLTLALATVLLFQFCGGREGMAFMSKINTVREVVEQKYVGDMDWEKAADLASSGIVSATGDPWSYYMSAEENRAYADRSNNSTTGIGVTVQADGEGSGFAVISVVPSSPADRAGIKAGCVIISVDEISLADMDVSEVGALIRSKTGEYSIGFIDESGAEISVLLSNEPIYTSPVSYEMLEYKKGYIRISDFEKGACDDSIKALEDLVTQGAEAIIFDVRSNPGGQLLELTGLLDYLLPEGELFISVSADGEEEIYSSDAECMDIPMAVLINGNSYSAAEFFAAALSEYGAAVTVGEPSTGKARSQQNFTLSDGSIISVPTITESSPSFA